MRAGSRDVVTESVNERLSLHWKTAGIDWARTRAFVIENANEGFIRINLKGRELEGVVQPGEEYERLRDTLFDTAKSLVNPANSRSAVHQVYKPQEMYRGPCRAQMPDVVITWDPEARVTTSLGTSAHGVTCSEHAAYEVTPYYTGNHRPNAFAAIVGPGVPSGRVLEGASILDLAPSILGGSASLRLSTWMASRLPRFSPSNAPIGSHEHRARHDVTIAIMGSSRMGTHRGSYAT